MVIGTYTAHFTSTQGFGQPGTSIDLFGWFHSRSKPKTIVDLRIINDQLCRIGWKTGRDETIQFHATWGISLPSAVPPLGSYDSRLVAAGCVNTTFHDD